MKVNNILYNGILFSLLSIFIQAIPAEIPLEHEQEKSVPNLNSADQEFIKLLKGDLPILSGLKKPHIKEGFGATWDYSSYLRQGEGVRDDVYKRRLKLLQYHLHRFCDPQVLGDQIDINLRSNALRQLKGFSNAWALVKLTGEAAFADSIVIAGFIPIKEDVFREEQTSVGTVFITNKNPDYPLFYVTDKDAVALLLRMHKIATKKQKPSYDEYKKIAYKFMQSDLNHQSRRMLKLCIYRECVKSEFLSGRVDESQQHKSINALAQAKAKLLFEKYTQEDQRKIKAALLNLSHFDSLDLILNDYFKNSIENKQTIVIKQNNRIVVDSGFEKVFQSLQKYLPVLDALQKEYSVIFQRITDELKKKKIPTQKNSQQKKESPKLSAQSPAPSQETKADDTSSSQESEKVVENIRYDKRILKWFKRGFIKRMPESRVRYHSLLPCCCDTIIVNSGEHSTWANRSRAGQGDDHYRLPGKVTYDDGTEDFYIFDVCLDPKGICYHRGCKKVSYDNLLPELQKAVDINQEDDTSDQADSEAEEMSQATILKDNELFATTYNPDYNCTITLYKIK